jgi:hypothetical protein
MSKCKGENVILNVQIQALKTKNMALKISDVLRNITTLNFELVYGFQMPHDKYGITFDKDLSLSNSKYQKNYILKEKQPKNIFIKNYQT